MSEFITLDKNHPNFKSYLRGDFSKTHMALPVKTLHIHSEREQVTFQIVKKNEILRPAPWTILAKVMRWDLLLLTFAPALTCLFYLRAQVLSWSAVYWALISLFFLHGAIFTLNDYMDHMRGIDRLSEKGGSQSIQKGWLRAATVHQLFYLFCFLALFSSVPVFLDRPQVFVFTLLAALLGVVGYPLMRRGPFLWLQAPSMLFLCLGPLLTASVNLALAEPLQWATVSLGTYFGLLAVIYLQFRNMISMVVDDQAGLFTLPVRFGFDRAKSIGMFFIIWAALFFFATCVSFWLEVLAHHPISIIKTFSMVLIAAVPTGLLAFLARRLWVLSSPLASSLLEFPRIVLSVYIASSAAIFGVLFLCQ